MCGSLERNESQESAQSVKVHIGTYHERKLKILKEKRGKKMQEFKRQNLKRRTTYFKSDTMVEDLKASILKVLSEASTVGATAKQIAFRTGYDVQIVSRQLEELHQEGKVERIGRKLWLLAPFKDINRDPEFRSPDWYIRLFKYQEGLTLEKYPGKITFSDNGNKSIHRWSPYVQGFSASFVETILDRYRIGRNNCVLDPFVGCGTVLVCARLRGAKSIGVDLMPLMTFASKVKTRWDLDIKKIETNLAKIRKAVKENPSISPPFLKETYRQFDKEVLVNLLKLKQSIWAIHDQSIRELFQLAFASILIECSRLKRSPCLSYVKEKIVQKEAPFVLFERKVQQMKNDLLQVQKRRHEWGPEPQIICEDSRKVKYEPQSIDIAITSPPYVNGMDYVINYKIEMAWLDMVKSYSELATLKNRMVACDNISRKVIKEFANKNMEVRDEWLLDIVKRIETKITQKGSYRRDDMHLIVQKYFEDLYPVLRNVYEGLKQGGRFVIVIGDSLIAGTYIPTDLILARLAKEIGFKIERIEIARKRRSGQRKSFVLRESVLTLIKGEACRPKKLDDFLDQSDLS